MGAIPDGGASHFRGPSTAFPDTIAIRVADQFVVVRVADIDWVEADGSYAKVHVAGQRPRVLTRTLARLEREVLDPGVFLRVHRSVIVNRRKIVGAEARENGRLTLVMHGGARVPCSRRNRHVLEERLYFTP